MQNNFFFSIILATKNSSSYIYDCLYSIKKQSFKNYELIVIDNCSTDKTIEIIKKIKIKNTRIYVGKDLGVYDAINKGISKARGKVISVLHSDDFYYDNDVLKKVNQRINSNTKIVFGNLLYVQRNNTKKIIRKWKGSLTKNQNFYTGWHPPHPTFFAMKELFKKYGLYKIEIGNSADVELMYRFLIKNELNFKYIDKTLITMRYGGLSNKSLLNIIKQNYQTLKFLKLNKNIFRIIFFILKKLENRIFQFLKK